MSGMVLSINTSFDIPRGMEVERIIGPCWGISIFARALLGRACVGTSREADGQKDVLNQVVASARRFALAQLERHAQRLGANAVLGVREDASAEGRRSTQFKVFGTAVRLRPSTRAA